MRTLINRSSLAVRHVANPTDNRSYCQGVKITDQTCTASNGASLYKVTHPITSEFDLREIGSVFPLEGQYIIDKKTIDKVLTRISKDKDNLGLHYVQVANSNDKISFATAEVDSTDLLTVKPIDARFPDMAKLFKDREQVEFNLGLPELERLVKVVKDFIGSDSKSIGKLSIPIKLSLSTEDSTKYELRVYVEAHGQTLSGIIMPLKS